ncbi:MAG: 4Fe-4S binding protein [Faecalibacterium prausnitzii]
MWTSFGQPMFESAVLAGIRGEEVPYHVQELTRREMLEQVSHGSKSGTKKLLQMLPGLRSEEDSGVDFRLLLHQRTKQLKAAMETPLQYGYYMPKFTDNCFGCGRCEKACRANALKFEEMPNGQTRMVLTPVEVQRVRRVHERAAPTRALTA